jgi:hypothetical protein
MNENIPEPTKNLIIRPDLLIEYSAESNYGNSLAVIYVRPETNKLSYEKAIIEGVKSFSDIVYMANLGGNLFIRDAIIFEHYASQYKFSIHAKSELEKYPEMINKFEKYFNIKFSDAKLIGAFDALNILNLKSSELFHTFVDSKDFIRMYGQTIKKLGEYFIINYDLPELIKKYDNNANVFVIVVRFREKDNLFFQLNQSISENILKDEHCPTIGEDLMLKYGQGYVIKRTYHISGNHISAMFDMVDFVFKHDGSHILFNETPLGKDLISDGIYSEETLNNLKEDPLVHINRDGQRILVNIYEEADGLSREQSIGLLKSIIE